MARFDNHAPVANQANHQYFQSGAQLVINTPPIAPPDYDLGVRLGVTSQIDNDLFVGRQNELQQLQSWLIPRVGKRNIVALCGAGGMGKTQLSLQFIRQSGEQYSTVYWLDARNTSTLKAGLAALALAVSEIEITAAIAVAQQDEEVLVQQAQRWLCQKENYRWLLLYDNYDDPQLPGISTTTGYDIRAYLPAREHGSILITSRSPDLYFARQLPLKKLQDEAQSLAILATRSGRLIDRDPSAITLVRRFDGLPLALATAGSYLACSMGNSSDYLNLYDQCWHDLSLDGCGPLDYEKRTLYTTWNMSYQQVQRQDTGAAELLRLLAYLDNQEVWYELLFAGHDLDNPPVWWAELLQNRARLNRAIRILRSYSLLDIVGDRCSLHPCIHDWTLEYLNHEPDEELYRIATHCVGNSVRWDTDTNIDYWVENKRLLPHARRLRNGRLQPIGTVAQIPANDLHNLGYIYGLNDMYNEAEEMYQRALAWKERELGLYHTSTLSMVNDLGILYHKQGKLDDAEEMYQRALAGQERILGPDHTTTLTTVNNLGVLYRDQGRLDAAEEMYQRALAGKESIIGPDHTETLSTVSNLGLLYGNQGRLDEAEKLFQRALAGYARVLGLNHVMTLDLVGNLGVLYQQQGKVEVAEQMYQRALAGFRTGQDEQDPRTRKVMETLAQLREQQAE